MTEMRPKATIILARRKTQPLAKPENSWRTFQMIGICRRGDEIVYVRCGVEEDVPRKQAGPDTVYASHILADSFDDNLEVIRQDSIRFKEKPYIQGMNCACHGENGRLFLNTFKYNNFVLLHDSWRNDHFARLYEIGKNGIESLGPSPDPVVRVYSDSKVFLFGDYRVCMASPFRMVCVDAKGKTLWTLKLSAYLYTDIEEKDGILHFGTAGKGGHFYGVRLKDGVIVIDLDTGGTTCYWWIGSRILLFAERKCDWLVFDPGISELVRVDPEGLSPAYPETTLVSDGVVYTTTYDKRTDTHFAARIVAEGFAGG